MEEDDQKLKLPNKTSYIYKLIKSYIEMMCKLENNSDDIFERVMILDALNVIIDDEKRYEKYIDYICGDVVNKGDQIKECKICSQKINVTFTKKILILVHYCHHHGYQFFVEWGKFKETGTYNFDPLYK
jgi:hypothetical protein